MEKYACNSCAHKKTTKCPLVKNEGEDKKVHYGCMFYERQLSIKETFLKTINKGEI